MDTHILAGIVATIVVLAAFVLLYESDWRARLERSRQRKARRKRELERERERSQ